MKCRMGHIGWFTRVVSLQLSLSLTACMAQAEAHDGFQAWLVEVEQQALAQQIPASAVQQVLSHAQWLPKVIELDRKQPEFVTSFSAYIHRRIQPRTVVQGKQMLQDYAGLLAVVEENYAVPREILVAFWALETQFGHVQGDFSLPAALTTLSYEGRRAEFFKRELFNLMRVVAAAPPSGMPILGSWAGATGQMQFMPSTLLQYGVDADRDGVVDIWSSLPDVFNSAAHYLSQVGWQAGAPVSVSVVLPSSFEYGLAQLPLKKPVAEWQRLGVAGIPTSIAPTTMAAIVLPQGFDGPAYMVFANFDVIMQWNRSVQYALSVSLLAQQFAQDSFNLTLPPEPRALTFQQMWALQETLNAQGFDCGAPDGFPGAKTQSAIRQYQAKQGLPQDGYAGWMLYSRLTEK